MSPVEVSLVVTGMDGTQVGASLGHAFARDLARVAELERQSPLEFAEHALAESVLYGLIRNQVLLRAQAG